MIRLQHCGVAALLVASIWTGWWSSTASAQAERSLPELLRATHIHGLAIDRSDPETLLIATHHGLHALDLETGITTQLSERSDDFMGFTPHPTARDTLYASGHPAHGGNLGFIASTDGGRTWTLLSDGVDGPVDFHQMDVSKVDSDVIYGVHAGLQMSRDGGHTWQRVGPAPEGLIDLAVSSTDPGTLYAATQQGLLVSTDGGLSWQPDVRLHGPVSLIETTSRGTIYAFMLGEGLLSATTGSSKWQTFSDAFGDRFLLHLAIDADDPDRLFASTQHNELLHSLDGGRSWRLLARP